MTKTLYDKLVDAHKVCDLPDGDMLIYVDFHIMNEYTSPQAFYMPSDAVMSVTLLPAFNFSTQLRACTIARIKA